MNTLIYHRVKHATSLRRGDTLAVSVGDEGDLFAGQVTLALDMVAERLLTCQGQVSRCLDQACRQAIPALGKAAGLSLAGDGVRRVKEALAGEVGCPLLLRLLLEGCRIPGGLSYSPIAQSQLHDAYLAGLCDQAEFQARLARSRHFWNSCVVWTQEGAFRKAMQEKELTERLPADYDKLYPVRVQDGGLEERDSAMLRKLERVLQFSVIIPRRGHIRVRGLLEQGAESLVLTTDIKLPELVITAVKGEMPRVANPECHYALSALQKIVGLRIEPGVAKRVRRVLQGPEGCVHFCTLAIESCRAAVHAALNAQMLELKAEGKPFDDEALLRRWLEQTPMLKDTCPVLAEGSPLVKRLGVWAEKTVPL